MIFLFFFYKRKQLSSCRAVFKSVAKMRSICNYYNNCKKLCNTGWITRRYVDILCREGTTGQKIGMVSGDAYRSACTTSDGFAAVIAIATR